MFGKSLAAGCRLGALEEKRLQNEVEEFMTTTFYHVLKASPKDKCVVLVERLGGMRILTETIAWVLFKKF